MSDIEHNVESIIKNYYYLKLGDHLISNGYSTGLTLFPGIDMRLSLPNGRYFKNDGIVSNIREHVQFLDKCFSIKNASNKDHSKSKGTCYIFNTKDNKLKVSVICVIDSGMYGNNLIYGHESVHAIRNLDLDNQFVGKLDNEGLKLRSLSEYKDEESIANLGVIIAQYNYNKSRFNNNPTLKIIYNKLLWECVDEDAFHQNMFKLSSHLRNLPR